MPQSAVADDFLFDAGPRPWDRSDIPPLTDETRLSPWTIAGLTVLGLGVIAAAIGGAV